MPCMTVGGQPGTITMTTDTNNVPTFRCSVVTPTAVLTINKVIVGGPSGAQFDLAALTSAFARVGGAI